MKYPIPTVYNVFDWTIGAWLRVRGRLFNKPSNAVNIRQMVLLNTLKSHENVVGRHDLEDRIRDKFLEDVGPKEEVEVAKRGAIKGEDGRWVVPDGVDLDKFKRWWPRIAEDLRDVKPRMTKTKNGRNIESELLASDKTDGDDSLATGVVYGSFVAIACLAYFVAQFSEGLGWLTLGLAFWPTVAIAQGESVWDAVKSVAMLLVVPFMMANEVHGTPGYSTSFMSLPGSGMADIVTRLLSLWPTMLVAVIIIVLFVPGGAGSKFETVKKAAIVFALLAALKLILVLLPPSLAWLKPLPVFMLAAMYSIAYAQGNLWERARALTNQSFKYNLGVSGSLVDVGAANRNEQALAAYKDKTPLICFGVAKGWLTRKQYVYAPDYGIPMKLSTLDMSMHTMCFGSTGSGKTSNFCRTIIKQYVDSNYGGVFIMDGKCALTGEVASLVDLVIEPGISLAPFEGLTAQGVVLALWSGDKNKSSRDQIWINGAKDFADHTTVVLEALKDHEKHIIKHAGLMATQMEDLIMKLHIEIEILARSGADVNVYLDKLEVYREKQKGWANAAEHPRKWFWTPSALNSFVNLADRLTQRDGVWTSSQDMIQAAIDLGLNEAYLNRSSDETIDMIDTHRLDTAPHTIHPSLLIDGSLLRDSLVYIIDTWPTIDPAQRSSFLLNFREKLNPLMRGQYLVDANKIPWHSIEHGVNVEQALYGKVVGANLPITVHGRAGLVISNLLKERIYKGVRNRNDGEAAWRARGEKPLMLMGDEVQAWVGESELTLLPQCRGFGMAFACASQTYDGMVSAFGSKVDADAFLDQFQNWMLLKSSEATYKYMSDKMGVAMMTVFGTPTVGLNYAAGVSLIKNATINDPNHPLRGMMKKLKRMGVGRLSSENVSGSYDAAFRGQKITGPDGSSISKTIAVPKGGKREIQPLFKPEDYTELLQGRGKAILLLQRAGVRRVDWADTIYVDETALAAKDEKVAEEA